MAGLLYWWESACSLDANLERNSRHPVASCPSIGTSRICCLCSNTMIFISLLFFLVCGGRGCSRVLTPEGPSGGSKLLSEYLYQWFFCLVNGVYCYCKTGWLDG